MNQNDERKTVNMVSIRPYIFNWVVEDANLTGEKISHHIGNLLEALYLQGGGKKTSRQIFKGNPLSEGIIAYHDAERKQSMRQMAKRMAVLYVENPTEESAENLQKMCDVADINYDEVIQVAKADPFSSIIAKTTGKQKIEQCILWLTEVFRKTPKVKSKEIMMQGSKHGYNRKMIQRARTILLEDPDTPFIDVEREGTDWWYILKDSEGNEIEATMPSIVEIYEPEYPKFIKTFLDTGRPVTIYFGDVEENE